MAPETSKVRNKMVYASSKDRFKRELDGIQVELQATDASEMSLDIVKITCCLIDYRHHLLFGCSSSPYGFMLSGCFLVSQHRFVLYFVLVIAILSFYELS